MGRRRTSRALVVALLLVAVGVAGCDTKVGIGAEGRGYTKPPLADPGLIPEDEPTTVMDELGDPILLPQAEQPGAAADAPPAAGAAPSPASPDTAVG